MAESVYTFLPWVRQGVAAALRGAQNPIDDPAAQIPASAAFAVKLALNDEDPSALPATTLKLFGPGHVTGFDPRQVVRTEPSHLTGDFEPNYFPLIEFDRPDFPWLFTPTGITRDGRRLPPWICLVTAEKREGVTLEPGQPLPILKIDQAQSELPDLSQCWAWAHAQVAGRLNPGESVASVASARSTSRLMCPRLLKPNTAYYACVVPVFLSGAKAGLGEAVLDGQGQADEFLKLAWDAQTGSIILPVYYSWEFATGEGGDFESLVGLLRCERTSASSSGRDMDVRTAGFNLPDASGDGTGVLPMEGALSVGGGPPAVSAAFQGRLANAVLASGGTPGATDAVLRPPIYGCWHAASPCSPNSGSRPWLAELNLHPTYRAAAALGARVVQQQQQQLMDSAWRQAGEIRRANQVIKQAQLARAAGTRVFTEDFGELPDESLLAVTAPVHSRTMDGDRTVAARLAESHIPPAALSPAFRRATRPHGPLGRRVGAAPQWTGRLIAALNRPPAPASTAAPGAATLPMDMAQVKAAFAAAGDGGNPEMRAAAERQLRLMPDGRQAPAHEPVSTARLRQAVLRVIDPRVAIERRVIYIITFPPGWRPEDPLETILAAPEFPAPMYKPLAEISQELLLPGIEGIPLNTIRALGVNRRFLEAYMAGLNHEMGRELLWRGFPTDQRGTYFRQFWDPRGHVPSPQTADDFEGLRDIGRMHEWSGKLGENTCSSSGSGQSVLVVRGDLFRRYPRAIIYAVKARWSDPAAKVREPGALPENPTPAEVDTLHKYPAFQGTLAPDISFFGFDVAPQTAKGDATDAGWYFVLQQPPAEPRHGLDASRNSGLCWDDVQKSPGGYVDLTASVATTDGKAWGLNSDSATLAAITLQGPFRVAIHATDLLP